ncbi:hypothetical protein COCSUDRAFT_60283 [Coccomyxa subellipsoidea C-169]|uniref:Protein kinase domain-containing protein n=1 Tax=Coccomyxa subellipsoidea (strain C-169) TaxID=574566 RepID=I0YIU4_COCSC|nr:hypothetical protein COCSUDRAFT_60283 [Coccomyxa subellipsoidea C-169]EIE18313.1 hypothetical protein COCSUDRAFT_60283 [Coccomyxa subellipsoidea C-169]|eukprot:XP_005642857.1 hypothetical protein COCSUDRAFT_60283 [Coccomyxa subellipsoidea C-169]
MPLGLPRTPTSLSRLRCLAHDLYQQLTAHDPGQRPSAAGALSHPWLGLA